MGKPEIEAFLSHLVLKRNVASSTQNQAFNAILFLYNSVLETDNPQDINALRSKKPIRLPTIMTREETLNLIRSMHGTHQLMAKLMYGSGLRMMECIRLRVKDIDFAVNQIIVRDGKGKKDRITVLPDGVKAALKEHLVYVKRLHQNDSDAGYGRVYLPNALARKYPNADRQWGWQYAFPAKTLSEDPRSGMKRRHHLHVSSIQKAIRKVVKLCAIVKPVGCHTMRHSGVYPPRADHPSLAGWL
jgi:integron integrase